MTNNGDESQATDPTAVVSEIRIGLRADGDVRFECMGQPLPDLVIAGLLAKAQWAALANTTTRNKPSSIVVPQVSVEMRS